MKSDESTAKIYVHTSAFVDLRQQPATPKIKFQRDPTTHKSQAHPPSATTTNVCTLPFDACLPWNAVIMPELPGALPPVKAAQCLAALFPLEQDPAAVCSK